MILPGDILWDRFRVARVETEKLGGAWLAPLHAFGGDTAAPAPTHLLFPLDSPASSAMAELLAAIWPGGSAHASAASISGSTLAAGEARAKVTLLDEVEWRGAPGHGGVALVETARAIPLNAPRTEHEPPAIGAVLKLLSSFAAALERLLNMAAARPHRAGRFCRAASALLNPRSVGLAPDGSRLVFLPEIETPESPLSPPYWTLFAAPEALDGRPCGEPALVFGMAHVAMALLFDPIVPSNSAGTDSAGNWRRLASPDVAHKEFKRDPRTAALPKEAAALLAKCLRPIPENRFATLAKFRAALKKLLRAFEADGAEPVLFPLAPIPAAPAVEIPPGMALIEAGPFLSGEKKSPRTLRAFAVDVAPVTEREYREFLTAMQREPLPNGPGSRASRFDKHPVTHVTWREAEEFAAHFGKRLPTIYEWEKAARGRDGAKFPYGNEYLPGTGKLRANGPNGAPGKDAIKETAPVGSFPKGASPYGVLDMAGNVLEWTSTARRQGERIFRALKGACFLDGSVELSRCAAIQYKKPETRENNVGFRCVKDLE